MPLRAAAAEAHPNIALIKYWGDRDPDMRIPANGSISLTLAGLSTVTRVKFDPELEADRLTINGLPADSVALGRVSRHLDLLREAAGIGWAAEVASQADFPIAAGLASSAAAFAALTLAASAAAGLELEPAELSALARRGSGSAARSIFGGYVELLAGPDHSSSVARPLANPEYWPLIDLIALCDSAPKQTSSRAGHSSAPSSPLQVARLADSPRRLQACREAVLSRDFDRLAEVVEQDSDMLHAVMMTSRPALHYWQPASLAVMSAVRSLRAQGVPACYTVDAGPNVHCLCPPEAEDDLRASLLGLGYSIELRRASAGPGVRLV